MNERDEEVDDGVTALNLSVMLWGYVIVMSYCIFSHQIMEGSGKA